LLCALTRIVCTTARKAVWEAYIPRIYNTIKDHLIGDLADKDITGCIATRVENKKVEKGDYSLIMNRLINID
jgi:hypothetical protein